MSTLEDKIAALENRIAALEKPGIDQGQFRLLFTFEERQAEEVFRQMAIKTVQNGPLEPADPQSPTQAEYDLLVEYARAQTYLTMRKDFDDASHINLADAAVEAALDFYIAVGLLAPERKSQVLANEAPA